MKYFLSCQKELLLKLLRNSSHKIKTNYIKNDISSKVCGYILEGVEHISWFDKA